MHRKSLDRLTNLTRGAAVLSIVGGAACANSGTPVTAPTGADPAPSKSPPTAVDTSSAATAAPSASPDAASSVGSSWTRPRGPIMNAPPRPPASSR